MNLTTPTTTELSDNIQAQIEGAIAQSVPLLPKAFIRVLAKALGGVFILLWKYAGWILLQHFVAYASAKETVINGTTVIPLVEIGRQFGVGDPLAAARAEHTVTVTVKTQTGSLPAGSQLLHASTGVVHTTTAAVALNAATVMVTVRATSDQAGHGGVGSIGNLQAGDGLQFANPLPNVARDAVVLARSVDGADAETVDAYRTRILRRVQQKPQGGALADYRQWGEELAGIVNLYPNTGDPGQVDVYVEASPASSGSADGIPTSGQLLEVKKLIDLDQEGLATRRPANAFVNVLPITRQAFDVVITGLVAPDVEAAKDAIGQAIDEHLRIREPFIVGLSALPRRDRVTQAAIGGVVDDTVSAVGGTVATVVLKLGGSPTPLAASTLGAGQKAKLGAVTYP